MAILVGPPRPFAHNLSLRITMVESLDSDSAFPRMEHSGCGMSMMLDVNSSAPGFPLSISQLLTIPIPSSLEEAQNSNIKSFINYKRSSDSLKK